MGRFQRFAHMTDPGGIRDQVVNTHEGMAHFAGTGPSGKVCAHCRHWRFGQERTFPTVISAARPKQAPCAEFARATRVRSKPVPFDALACKRFEPHPDVINQRLHTLNPE